MRLLYNIHFKIGYEFFKQMISFKWILILAHVTPAWSPSTGPAAPPPWRLLAWERGERAGPAPSARCGGMLTAAGYV